MISHLQYINFLNTLLIHDVKIHHFIAYRKNKINNISYENELKQIPTHLPNNANVEKIFIENDNDKYVNYKNNVHHWTTEYCWKNVIPLICKKINIKFNPNIFKLIPFKWKSCDFSYHELDNMQFEIYDSMGKKQIGNHEILRSVNDCPNLHISLYHSLFKLSHSSGRIINLYANNNIKCVFNCDSMAIPIIPIIACLCKEIFVIDNRSGIPNNNLNKIISFNPTIYISLFTEENFLFTKKYLSNLQ